MVDLLSNRLHENEWCVMLLPSQQIFVPRTSQGRPPPTYPRSPLKILFDRHGDVPIWRLGQRPNLTSWGRPEMTSKGCTNLTFRGRPWEVDSGCPRMFSGRPLEDLQSTQTFMSRHFFKFSFRTYLIDQIYLIEFFLYVKEEWIGKKV